jgi:hypothetical protein
MCFPGCTGPISTNCLLNKQFRILSVHNVCVHSTAEPEHDTVVSKHVAHFVKQVCCVAEFKLFHKIATILGEILLKTSIK